jgi:predicted metal-dependent enzyme (double-stranded beta helix superfamily)
MIKSLEKGFNGEELTKALMDLREDALEDEDPLLAKVLRLASEYITEEECFDHTVEKEEDDEGEEFLIEPGTDAENLTYLLHLIKGSENKFNREEIKEMRTFLKLKLY